MNPENILPGTEDLFAELNFDPKKGLIWLGNQRMFLVDADAFGAFRRDLIETIGFAAAKELISRFGYISGAQDARLAREIRKDKGTLQQLAAGPQLHAIKGFLWSEHSGGQMLPEEDTFNTQVHWEDSVEADIHIQAYGIGSMPACWMEVGYSEGFMSTLSGRKIEVRELECRAMGHERCHAVARPVEEWEQVSPDRSFVSATTGKTTRDKSIRQHKIHRQYDKSSNIQSSAVGSSAVFNTVLHRIQRVAPTSASVLLLGESGVGKTLLAKEIHSQSSRKDKPFVEVNCAAIPEQLMESEMFGVEKGAFTGALQSRSGRFEAAHQGTIFLDEISLLPLTAQSKLLRILQTGDMEHLGSNKTLNVDVRVIAATNDNLEGLIRKGKFREDLFYRLNVFPIQVPPLRKRLDDLPDLVEMCLRKFSRRHGKKVSRLTSQAFEDILNYDWPGNIRELENVIERGVVLANQEETIDTFHLFTHKSGDDGDWEAQSAEQPLRMLKKTSSNTVSSPRKENTSETERIDIMGLVNLLASRNISVEDLNIEIAAEALSQCEGNVTKAARMIGISRAQLSYKMKKGVI